VLEGLVPLDGPQALHARERPDAVPQEDQPNGVVGQMRTSLDQGGKQTYAAVAHARERAPVLDHERGVGVDESDAHHGGIIDHS